MEIDEISKYLSPITVGFIAAYFGSLLALNKSKKEKLWDERKAIYKEIIEAFEELGGWSEYTRACYSCEPTIDVNVNFDEPLRVISKRSAIGSLFLSEAFQKVLEEANIKLGQTRFQINEESMPDMYSEQGRAEWSLILSREIREIVDNYLPKLISIAKKEIPK
ncbi:hypothetical protein [uncultured Desulfobacter sp.]|uniref:hypothetical protein n=1 Tax=uncultured Desulfobacter sp. TaxID=240139 RepID=UPI002AAB24E5|nr:hypothetical protein [uncultured Desulfobacter sp.]